MLTATNEAREAVDTHPLREVRHEYSPQLPSILERLGISLLVSTYQAGKVVALSARAGAVHFSFHNFDQAMGIAVSRDAVAVGSRSQVWFLRSAADLAPRLERPGQYDACYLTRSSAFTGEIQVHEMAWAGPDLWLVNTSFSCLCTLDGRHSFVPRWQPPFITALAAEDRCHLNGVAFAGGRPQYVTALAETDTPQGWRPDKATSGCLIEVATGRIVVRGLSMPHSPRLHDGRVWLLNSGRGQLLEIEPATGAARLVAELPGYTRGLALHGGLAFVGLSRIRETSTFGGVPIAEIRDLLKCGVGVIELGTGRLLAHVEFVTGVEEIFDVQVLPGVRSPALSGPFPALDGGAPIWLVPSPRPGS